MTKRKPLEEHKPTGRRPWRFFSDEEVAEMARMWHDGCSQTSIAKTFQTSQPLVSRVLRSNGIEPVKRPGTLHGPQSSTWKGGRIRMDGGYIGINYPKDGPLAVMKSRLGYILEHRLVMAEHLGRPLGRHETVHHINGVRDDNRLENLQLRQGRHGSGVVMQCADCGSHNISSTMIAEAD